MHYNILVNLLITFLVIKLPKNDNYYKNLKNKMKQQSNSYVISSKMNNYGNFKKNKINTTPYPYNHIDTKNIKFVTTNYRFFK